VPDLNSEDIRADLVKYASFILNRRPYFRHKLQEKLVQRCRKRQVSDYQGVIKDILDDLSQSGYLNDAYLAEGYVRRQLSKGYGPRLIKLKLAQLKLTRDAIDQALESQAGLEAVLGSARAYLGKKRYSDPRQATYNLLRRGFGPEVLRRLFDVEVSSD